MRLPPYYRNPAWQRFIAGMAVGGAISWCIFLYIFGVWQEDYSKLILKQQKDIEEYKEEIKIWQKDYEELNNKNQEKMTVQKINIRITNWEKYKLDQFSVFQTEESVKDDIKMVLAKDLETVSKTKDLITKIIENKPIKINNKRYKLEVKELVIYTTLTINIEIHFDE
ncbi:sporulation membrane protein YtrI [Neobacillus thermocopriae]|uniref:Sporulation protein n=1 Tax=Neobacillus thermocopriae TaxID=1215031 RepID=A0A6B3TQ31_9BACI|nr:sporulation membrane protein YtrI [Neobacillus thermocopriae]MED3622728.1 sporulation protein [Neobacillus thermocopriae]MED3714164.1 sporulation protein [Neobacillus thermocopriae]NEX78449.1 sporulation protein [Neobacillus thermocopriae]